LVVSEGKILFTWGKGDTGCLGFGDEEDILLPTAHPLFWDTQGFDLKWE